MRSTVPKVLQPICGREMVGLVADALRDAGLREQVAIVPPNSPELGEVLGPECLLVEQAQPLGTAHALSQARATLADHQGSVLVINGDVPLLTSRTLSCLRERHDSTQDYVTILTATGGPTEGLGRVARRDDGAVQSIVEAAEATAYDVGLPEINVGAYCFRSPWVWSALDELSPSVKGELYLTDLVALAVAQGLSVGAVTLDDPWEGLGVNDGVQLARAREVVRRRINEEWLLTGVTIMEPAFIDITVELEPDTIIYPNTFLQGSTRIGPRCEIGPGSIIVNSTIAGGCRILSSVVEEAILEEEVEVGPYSHIRPESYLEREVHIGNFSEVKKSRLGRSTKMGHFSYLGDAQVGANVNIGAGTITCNFDGTDKNETVIGDGAFIGSDSMLIAPVHIGAGASTGAGSVVNRDVPAGTKVVGAPARAVQTARRQEGQG